MERKYLKHKERAFSLDKLLKESLSREFRQRVCNEIMAANDKAQKAQIETLKRNLRYAQEEIGELIIKNKNLIKP